MTNLAQLWTVQHSLGPLTITTMTTTNGSAVDCENMDAHVTGIFCFGDVGDANTNIEVLLTESDTETGTYTAIPGASKTFSGSTTANDYVVTTLSTSQRTKRYVRCRVVTSGSGTPSVPVSAIVLGRKKISGTGTGYVS